MPNIDTKMVYDYDSHRYVLNHEGNGEHLNVAKAYGSIENIKANLRSISRTIYTYIYTHTHTANRDYIEYLLATDESLRKVLYEAMLSQLEADVESGLDSVKNQAGINFENGSIIDRSAQMRYSISAQAEMILLNGNGKTNIFYMGDRGFRMNDNRYEMFGY
jgi:hypothetical protein